MHDDTRTHSMALCLGLPRWAGTRKVKPIWILLKQEIMSGSDISWAICKSAPRSRQITMPAPHHSVFYRPDALPAAQPTASKHWRQYKCYADSLSYCASVQFCVFFLQLFLLCWCAFSALTLLVGRQEGIWPVKTEWWGTGVVICLEWGADWHMAQLMPLPLTVSCSSKIQIGFLPFWYRLTQVVLEKRPLNGCSVVVVVFLHCLVFMLWFLMLNTLKCICRDENGQVDVWR